MLTKSQLETLHRQELARVIRYGIPALLVLFTMCLTAFFNNDLADLHATYITKDPTTMWAMAFVFYLFGIGLFIAFATRAIEFVNDLFQTRYNLKTGYYSGR